MLENVLIDYAHDTENPVLNYKLGIEYENIGQTASAISYLLRAAERTNDDLLKYECLIRIGHCFDRQQNRTFTVKSMYRRAITVLPDRPEAYYFLCKYLAYETNFAECYTFCKIAEFNCKEHTYNDLRISYPGKWGMLYLEALSSWWYGKTLDSGKLFKLLKMKFWDKMDDYHRQSVESNLTMIESKIGAISIDDLVVETKTTKDDTKKQVEAIYPEYDNRHGNWGWATLNKAGCFIDYVDEICNEFENPICVEIGVYAGKSVLPMALELKRHGKGKLYAIDPWSNEEATKGYDGPNYEYWSKVNLKDIYNIYEGMIREFDLKDQINTIVDASDNVPEIKNISLLHIDGQHTVQAVRDARKFASQVSLGGYCVVDDVKWGVVSTVPEELEKMGYIHVHSVDDAMVFKRCCVREDIDGIIGFSCKI